MVNSERPAPDSIGHSTPLMVVLLLVLVAIDSSESFRPVAAIPTPPAQNGAAAKSLSMLKTFARLDTFSQSKEPKVTRVKLEQNLTPLEYEIQLDFSDSGKFQNNIDGLVVIYVQFTPKESGPNWMKKFKDAVSCKSIGYQNEHDVRRITLHVGAGVTLLDGKLKLSSSLGVLRQNKGDEIKIESRLLDERSRLMSLSLSKSAPSGSFGRLQLEFRSFRKYDFVQYAPSNVQLGQPPSSPLEAYVNFRFAQDEAAAVTISPWTLTPDNTFPCFNVPKFKSKISLTVLADRELRAYSNTPTLDRRDDPEGRRNLQGQLLVRTKFVQTSPMPIHKLVYTLGPYELAQTAAQTTGRSSSLPQVRVVSPSDLKPAESASSSRSEFALELAEQALNWMTRKLNQKLPIKQLDLIAVHARDFNATSGPGCALINAKYLLVDPQDSSPETRILVAWNVARIVAQQWLGHLLTARRWRDQWILDGLSGQLALEMLHELRPDLGVYHYVRSHLLPRAMFLVAKRAINIKSNRVDNELNSDDGEGPPNGLAEETFELSYLKSISLVGMLQNRTGRERFQAVLKELFETDSSRYGDLLLDQQTLFDALAHGQPARQSQRELLSKFINAWLRHPSFPTISIQNDISNSDQVVQLYENPVHKLQRIEVAGPWPNRNGVQIPLRVTFSAGDGGQKTSSDLPEAFKAEVVSAGAVPKWNGELIQVPDWFPLRDSPQPGHWLTVSPLKRADQSVTLPFYRVRYMASARNLFQRFAAPIENLAMEADDRASLLEDVTNLLEISPKLGSTSVSIDQFVGWFKNERVPQVIDAELRLRQALEGCQLAAASQNSIKQPLRSAVRLFQRNGFLAPRLQDTNFELFVRSAALVDLIESNYGPAIETALKIFDQTPAQRMEAAFLRPAIYAALARAGSRKQLERLLERLRRTRWPEEIDRLLQALKRAHDDKVREQALEWCRFRALCEPVSDGI